MSDIILERSLSFPGLKTFSVNASYVRTNRGVLKSSGLMEWTGQFFNLLAGPENQEKINQLKSTFDASLHVYHIEIIVNSPDIYTAKGEISSKAHDLSNLEKSILDCVLLPKFCNEPFPLGCNNLSIDDKYVTRLVSEKVPNKNRSIGLKISIVLRPKI